MKILIVEDDSVCRKKLEWLIKMLDYEPISAENGKEGFEIWKSERPRIVITDWLMPDMDGIELCKNIRASEGGQYTYIIIVTAKNETEDIVAGMDAGADDFISKPYVKEELLVRIRSGKRIVDFESRNVVILAISKLAESRDHETGNHLERIRHYSKILAETMLKNKSYQDEINRAFIDNIFLSSPLHDIGKIGIPDYILLKADRLDTKEYEIMKSHTTIGFNTLNETMKSETNADYLKMSAEIALSHHEKFDGTGYPYGLKGKEIPLSARIVSLADVYDALVCKRVYKNALPHEIAKSIIIEEKGSHFDPIVLDAFLKSEKEFLLIHDSYADKKYDEPLKYDDVCNVK